MKRCFNCLKEFEDTLQICPHCRTNQSTIPVNEQCLRPGTYLLKRYMVGRVLGQGGFGITYAGWDSFLRRKIAIKEYYPGNLVLRQANQMVKPMSASDKKLSFQSGLKSFINEAVKLARFQKSGVIVNVYDCIQTNNTAYIIMELVEGRDLGRILKKKNTLPYEEAKKLICSLLEALEPVHKTGLIHRDISPSNLMMTESGEIRLIDFGSAREILPDKETSMSVILKSGYAPLEQYQRHGKQGPGTDIYAVGATFYRMITGKTPQESLNRMMEDAPLTPPSKFNVQLPASDEAAILKSLSLRYEDRFSDAGAFLAALMQTENNSEPAKEEPSAEPAVITLEYLQNLYARSGLSLADTEILIRTLQETAESMRQTPEPNSISLQPQQPSVSCSRSSDTHNTFSFQPSELSGTPFSYKNLKPGDFFTFGRYFNQSGFDTQSVEWQVLNHKDGIAMVISRYALDVKPFHTERGPVIWKNSFIRYWLNDIFFKSCFNAQEASHILNSVIGTQDPFPNGVIQNSVTSDCLFLLSVPEVQQLNMDLRTTATPYAWSMMQMMRVLPNTWVLRTPGWDKQRASRILSNGMIDFNGWWTNDSHLIRPAFYLHTASME